MRLKSLLRHGLDRCLGGLGYVRRQDGWSTPFDIPEEDRKAVHAVDGFTMTSLERRYHLLESVRHVVKHRIPGDIVECGVWRGGSMMLVARTLLACGDTSRHLYLYDTFEGMPPPSAVDKDCLGESAEARLRSEESAKSESSVWAIAGLEEVKRNLASVGYPADKLHFVPGKVETTIPERSPGQIAILRLDTDWYDSTVHELAHLYPRLVSGGVLIFDDYGFWQGARKAADEFLAATPERLFLHRIDNSGRAFVRP